MFARLERSCGHSTNHILGILARGIGRILSPRKTSGDCNRALVLVLHSSINKKKRVY